MSFGQPQRDARRTIETMSFAIAYEEKNVKKFSIAVPPWLLQPFVSRFASFWRIWNAHRPNQGRANDLPDIDHPKLVVSHLARVVDN